MSEPTSFLEITENIIKRNQCICCGACIDLCPYLTVHHGTIVFPDACDLAEGRCLQYCPKGITDMETLAHQVWNGDYEGLPLGPKRHLFMARGTQVLHAQYGGIVSTLIREALAGNGVSGALMTRWRDRIYPEGLVIQNPEEISHVSGVHYAGAYTLSALNRFRKKHRAPVAIVGLPCQILATHLMHLTDHPENLHKDMDDLLIGLFCTWALSPRSFIEAVQQRYGNRKILRYDIPPPPADHLEILFDEGKKEEIPLRDIRPLINPGCHTCLDMTAEFADISVGAAEGFPEWNTVIIRTEKGAALFDHLVHKGLIETLPLPDETLQHLIEAAARKKKRALALLEQEGTPLGRFNLSDKVRQTIKTFPFKES